MGILNHRFTIPPVFIGIANISIAIASIRVDRRWKIEISKGAFNLNVSRIKHRLIDRLIDPGTLLRVMHFRFALAEIVFNFFLYYFL